MQSIAFPPRFIHLVNHEAQVGSISFLWTLPVGKKLAQLVKILLAEGVISHFEKQANHRVGVKFFLNYRYGSPALVCSRPFTERHPSRFINHKDLYRFVAMRPGATVLLSTRLGLLTHKDCIKKKIGGFYFCMLHR